MAIDKLTPQYLNQDDDERIVQPFEMVDALNIRVSHEDDGDAGVIKNVEGNQTVAAKSSADTIPSTGLNKVIGAVSSEAHRAIYFFLYNGNGNHGIYKYTARPTIEGGDAYQKVYESSDLNFGLQTYVSADLIVTQEGEHLLYFTDNRNEPRKINATKALSGVYGSEFTSGTEYEKNLFLTVCKQPPLTPPTFKFKNNPKIRRNQISEKLFQFAYQYVYDDGEVSALSPYSKIAVSPTHIAFNSAQREIYEGLNNEIEITLKCSVGPVDKIRVFAREGQNGFFQRIEEIDNNPLSEEVVTEFDNSGLYVQLDEDSSNKLFDSVPRLAATQTFSNSRLFYGNYLEGFDNIKTDALAYPVYSSPLQPATLDVSPRARFDVEHDTALGPSGNAEYYTTALAVGGLMQDHVEINTGGFGAISGPGGVFEDVQQSFSGKPIGFEIDTSLLPDAGLAVSATMNLNYVIQGESIGMAQTSEYLSTGSSYNYERNSFNVDIELRHEGSVVNHGSLPGTQISVLNPAKYSFYDTQNNVYDSPRPNTPRWGSLNDLEIKGSFELNESIEVDANTSKDDMIDLIVNAINDSEPLTLSVGSRMSNISEVSSIGTAGMHGKSFDYWSLVRAKAAGANNKVSNNVYQAPGKTGTQHQEWIWIEWDGAFTLKADAFYSAVNDAVMVRYTTTRVDLDAQTAFVAQANDIGSGQDTFVVNGALMVNDYSNWSPAEKLNDSGHKGHVYGVGDIICGIHTGDVSSNTGGLPLRDIQGANGAEFATAISEMRVTGAGILVPSEDDVEENKSFKSGATHEFGVVYFDDRNRPSGVQKLDTVETAHLGHNDRNGRHGSTAVDLRIMHRPPEWANRWAPVYSANNTYESFLQFTVSEALLPDLSLFRDILSPAGTDEEEDTLKNSRLINSSLGDSIRSTIFLSMRTLEGKSNSYKEFKGAEISYEYKEGDVLRIISYETPQGNRVYPQNKEFKITGYHHYQNDDANPLEVQLQSSPDPNDDESVEKDNNYRRTGWFLSIRDNNYSNFNRAAVETTADYFGQRCIVEILRPKKSQEDAVFYEIGESYPVVSVDGELTHGGDRENTGITGKSCTIINSNFFESLTRFYIGDKVIFDDGDSIASPNSSGFAFVAGVIPLPSGFRYYVDSSNSFSTATFGQEYDDCSLSDEPEDSNGSFPGVVTLRDGDVYIRQREMLVNAEVPYTIIGGQSARRYNPGHPREQEYVTFTVEDSRASDFFDSSAKSYGRAHIETPEQKRIRRFSSITYSDPLAFDSSELGLSSFNPSKFPYKDMPSQHGGVTGIEDGNESLTVLQQSKVSFVPINRNLVQMGQDSNLITSNEVMGTATFLAGSYGPGNCPEGIVNRFGVIYFTDPNSGVVCSVSSKGILPISSAKMESYFENLLGSLSNSVARPKIPSGFDPENSEYIITSSPVDMLKIVIDDSTIGYAESAPTGADQDDIVVQPVFGNALSLRWDNDPLEWDETSAWLSAACTPKWDDLHNGIIFIDRVNDSNGCYLDSVFEDDNRTTDLRIEVVDEAFSYRGSAHISLQDYSVTFCENVAETDADGGTQELVIESITNPDNSTIAWSPTAEKWLTFYSFVPEMYANIQNKFFSFKDGQMWEHNKLATRNRFYGTDYDSKIEIISKGNPSSVKAYKAISLEGDSKWKTTLSNAKQRAAVIEAAHYNEKEGMYYANVPRVNDANVQDANEFEFGESSYRFVGKVESVDAVNNTITFTTIINDAPVITGSGIMYRIRSGDTHWTAVGGDLKITSVDSRTKVSTNSDPSSLVQAGDLLANAYGSGVSGDVLRGYYAKVKLENNESTSNELYAVNLVYDPSGLHNEGGQPNNQ